VQIHDHDILKWHRWCFEYYFLCSFCFLDCIQHKKWPVRMDRTVSSISIRGGASVLAINSADNRLIAAGQQSKNK